MNKLARERRNVGTDYCTNRDRTTPPVIEIILKKCFHLSELGSKWTNERSFKVFKKLSSLKFLSKARTVKKELKHRCWMISVIRWLDKLVLHLAVNNKENSSNSVKNAESDSKFSQTRNEPLQNYPMLLKFYQSKIWSRWLDPLSFCLWKLKFCEEELFLRAMQHNYEQTLPKRVF